MYGHIVVAARLPFVGAFLRACRVFVYYVSLLLSLSFLLSLLLLLLLLLLSLQELP